MGLSDIDEDEPVTHSPRGPVVMAPPPPPPIVRSSTAATTATSASPMAVSSNNNNTSVLDDLFGSISVSGSASQVGASVSPMSFTSPLPVPQRTAPAASAAASTVPSVLDDLFATPAAAAAAPGSGEKTGKAGEAHTMIYVDGSSGGGVEDDGTNLFDLSKPVKRDKYNNAESFLEAFERQGKKGGVGRTDERDTLAKLTRNKDDNKVRARLLALMNYYDVLGVAPTASEEEIRRSYKKKALELHPDRVGRNQTPEEAELFKVITKANEVLTDPQQRRQYNASLAGGAGQPAPAPSAADWWSHMQT
ncbi:DNAJ protein-like protein [Novymonas esmeraldas]|uniref:DNAJ protein-like protein n=1 Tax=Novymonas esmeraldas TaxID=1808958 RepID=A0AAW0ER71_9TRYP